MKSEIYFACNISFYVSSHVTKKFLLTLLHSEWPKLNEVLAILSAIRLKIDLDY